MIGTHTVALLQDPTQAWGSPVNTNPDFATDLAGWVTTGTADKLWHWSSGAAVSDAGAGAFTVLGQNPGSPVLRNPAVAQYRLATSFTSSAAGTAFLTIGYGNTPTEAALGTRGSVLTSMSLAGPGTYTLELLDPHPAPFPYMSTAFQLNGAGALPRVEYLQLIPYTGKPPVDLSCLVDQVSIHYGRDDSDSQPEANAATIDLSVDTTVDPFPVELEVGAIITVTTALPGVTSTRFAGHVTDIAQGWEEAGPDTPDRAVAQVIATGPLADYGRRVVGATPWPQQLDGERVAAVFAAAGLTLNPATSDPGTVQILARDVDSQPALDVAQSTAISAGGVVWSTPAGDVRYADANHRRGTVAALVLDACDILVTPTWRRTTEALVNDVSIGYGIAPGGGEQPRFLGDRPDSKTRYGVYGYTTTTELAAAADAAALGTMLLTRNSAPVWIMSALPVDVVGLDAADTTALLSLAMHDLVQVTGLPAAGTVPTSAYLWVEGWTETLTYGRHDLELVVSGFCRTAPPPRWNDVTPATTWDSAGAMTWDAAACFGPLTNLGRWDDTPATLRWDQVPPATTWDNYTPTTSGGR